MKSSLKLQGDRIAAVAFAAAGGLFLLLGWLRISDTPYPAEQLPYILSGGIAGIFFLGLGATLWISADLRDEWTTFDRIEDALRDLAGERTTDVDQTVIEDVEAFDAPAPTPTRRRASRSRLVAPANGVATSESAP